jgi:hypothetical protein
MTQYKLILSFIFSISVTGQLIAQDMLIKTDAVEIALENNYNIKIARATCHHFRDQQGLITAPDLPGQNSRMVESMRQIQHNPLPIILLWD